MTLNYKKKYLIYKLKYLKLKGGAFDSPPPTEKKAEQQTIEKTTKQHQNVAQAVQTAQEAHAALLQIAQVAEAAQQEQAAQEAQEAAQGAHAALLQAVEEAQGAVEEAQGAVELNALAELAN